MSQVTCANCQVTLDIAAADVTGRGYRCGACTRKASLSADLGNNDVSDHLTDDERRARYAAAGLRMVSGGVIAAGGALVTMGFGLLFGAPVVFLGLGTISHGYLTRREMTGQRTS